MYLIGKMRIIVYKCIYNSSVVFLSSPMQKGNSSCIAATAPHDPKVTGKQVENTTESYGL